MSRHALANRGLGVSSGVVLAPLIDMLSGARVLVADDDVELLEAVGDALSGLGADVTRASSGAELIENLAEKGPFDLVVTDLAMPWMTGVQAMHAARTAGLGTSVIVMTALRDDTIPARVRGLGENAALLQKPFTLTELETAVTALLAQRSREPKANHDPDAEVQRVAS